MKNSINRSAETHIAKITPLGAALEVTGSCHLLEFNDTRILLDCGMLQGSSAMHRTNRDSFAFRPNDITLVVLSHAHLDHSGALPKLVSEGFDGPIYCTEETSRLLPILLQDAFKLYERDLVQRNVRRKRVGKDPLPMVYAQKDVDQVLAHLKTIPFDAEHSITEGVMLRFHDAGHILGAAIVELRINHTEGSRTLVFSGDLGNRDTVLMNDPAHPGKADIVLLESTYGDRNHRDHQATLDEFEDIIRTADRQEGNILIPAFAVGRTQELLFTLGCLYQAGKLKGWKVFLDSPMAKAVTKVYDLYMAGLDKQDTGLMKAYGSLTLEDFLPCLTVSESVEESMLINDCKAKAIIIAGSGMCTGGRIRHHFKQRIWRDDTHIVFVGFQAEGTVGRRLVDGVEELKLFGQKMVVKAQIYTIGGFSAHAGQDELVAWADAFEGKPKFCLVHGEQHAVVELRNQLLLRAGIDAEIAIKGASVYF